MHFPTFMGLMGFVFTIIFEENTGTVLLKNFRTKKIIVLIFLSLG